VDDINVGYQSFQTLQVLRVNGTEVVSLAHLKELVDSAGSQYVTVELEDDRTLVVDRQAGHTAGERIKERYRVPHLMSKDLAAAS
jgi:hypothetical protein